MRVELYELSGQGEDKLIATFRLQDGKIVTEPDDEWLQVIVAEPLYDPREGKAYDSEATPEEWLRHLHQQYRSAYLRATKVIED